jgi:hypothetical protein
LGILKKKNSVISLISLEKVLKITRFCFNMFKCTILLIQEPPDTSDSVPSVDFLSKLRHVKLLKKLGVLIFG